MTTLSAAPPWTRGFGALALAWLAGTAWQLQQAALWERTVLLQIGAVAFAALLLLVLLSLLSPVSPLLSLSPLSAPSPLPLSAPSALRARRWRAGWPACLTLWAAVIALAFVATSWRAHERLAQALPAALEGQDLVLSGRVASLPRNGLSGSRFVFEVDSATRGSESVAVPPRLSLAWYRGMDEDAMLGGPPEDLRAGQRWRFTVRLKQAHGLFNPGGFDLELWLFEQGILATGQVRSRPGALPVKLQERSGLGIHRLRQDVRDAIVMRVPDPALAGVLAALSIGDQAAIERADWEVFRLTGVAHLMSISGLHITMLAWLAALLAARLWRLNGRCCLLLPAQQAGRWTGLVVALAYAAFAGWGVPAQRTVCMLAVVVALRSAGWRWPAHAVLLAAALAVTLFDPWALLQPGFWLSFAAVALLVSSEPVQAAQVVQEHGPVQGQGQAQAHDPARDPADDPGQGQGQRQRQRHALSLIPGLASPLARARKLLREAIHTQLVATVGLAPLSMLFFQQISVVGFVANLVAIPLVTLLVTPLALLGMLLPPLWVLAGWVVQALMVFLQALATLPGASWSAAAAAPWAVVCGLLGGLLAIAPLPWRWRVLALPFMLPLLAPAVQRPAPGQFEAVAADVGQGTAVLVRTRHHLLVYDSGPVYSSASEAGSRVLLPLLRHRGERRVDLLMLSHKDSDHVGGAAALMAGLPVLQLSSSLLPEHPLLQRGVPHRPCHAGQRWSWDGVHFEVLHPLPGDPGQSLKPNAVSCVLRVQGSGHSLLLTGDIEAAQEAALVRRAASALRSDWLLVPHHGSRTSSTPAFLAAVAPQQAVVQAAYRSRFGHPAPDVLARYAARGVPVWRSDQCGALTLKADAVQVCERFAERRYWHHAGAQTLASPP